MLITLEHHAKLIQTKDSLYLPYLYYYVDNRLMSTTDYSGIFVYKNGHIDYVQTSEGRMKRATNGIFNAEYFIKDHLGDVRVVFSISGPSQVTDYYPFGLEIAVSGTSDNKIKYNSKELQTDAKLDWYDYGARFYDPVLARWHSVDPMAESSRRWSPYTYCMNNPIRFIDPDGMRVDDFYFDNNGKLLKYVENDKPDRVFIATDKTEINSSEENPMPEPFYEQVEMTSGEIEQKMDENGYKKVKEEETIEVTEMTTYYTDADGGNTETSKTKTDNKILDQETMFVTKNKSLQDTDVKYLGNIERKHYGSFMIEKNIEKRTYDYDNKPNPLHNENVNKTVQFIFKIIQSLQ